MREDLKIFIENNIIPERRKHKRNIIIFFIIILIFIVGMLLFLSRVSDDMQNTMDAYGIFGLVLALVFGTIIYRIISPFEFSYLELKSSVPNPKKLYVINGRLIEKQAKTTEEIDTLSTGQHYIEHSFILIIRLENNEIVRLKVNEPTYNNFTENENIEVVTDGKGYYNPLNYIKIKKRFIDML